MCEYMLKYDVSGTFVRRSRSKDPFNLQRFINPPVLFSDALAEIKKGKKVSHWSWYYFPTPPFVINGVIAGSAENQKWCLQDKPGSRTGDCAAAAFLRNATLRYRYLEMMNAISTKLRKRDAHLQELIGEADVPKLRSSLLLFERVSSPQGRQPDDEVHGACTRCLDLINGTST